MARLHSLIQKHMGPEAEEAHSLLDRLLNSEERRRDDIRQELAEARAQLLSLTRERRR
jgi:hypothetical protein